MTFTRFNRLNDKLPIVSFFAVFAFMTIASFIVETFVLVSGCCATRSELLSVSLFSKNIDAGLDFSFVVSWIIRIISVAIEAI